MTTNAVLERYTDNYCLLPVNRPTTTKTATCNGSFQCAEITVIEVLSQPSCQ